MGQAEAGCRDKKFELERWMGQYRTGGKGTGALTGVRGGCGGGGSFLSRWLEFLPSSSPVLIQSGFTTLAIAKISAARNRHPEIMVSLSISHNFYKAAVWLGGFLRWQRLWWTFSSVAFLFFSLAAPQHRDPSDKCSRSAVKLTALQRRDQAHRRVNARARARAPFPEDRSALAPFLTHHHVWSDNWRRLNNALAHTKTFLFLAKVSI